MATIEYNRDIFTVWSDFDGYTLSTHTNNIGEVDNNIILLNGFTDNSVSLDFVYTIGTGEGDRDVYKDPTGTITLYIWKNTI